MDFMHETKCINIYGHPMAMKSTVVYVFKEK